MIDIITEAMVERAKQAASKILTDEAGGCFNPSDEPGGECADSNCYCNRILFCGSEAWIKKHSKKASP